MPAPRGGPLRGAQTLARWRGRRAWSPPTSDVDVVLHERETRADVGDRPAPRAPRAAGSTAASSAAARRASRLLARLLDERRQPSRRLEQGTATRAPALRVTSRSTRAGSGVPTRTTSARRPSGRRSEDVRRVGLAEPRAEGDRLPSTATRARAMRSHSRSIVSEGWRATFTATRRLEAAVGVGDVEVEVVECRRERHPPRRHRASAPRKRKPGCTFGASGRPLDSRCPEARCRRRAVPRCRARAGADVPLPPRRRPSSHPPRGSPRRPLRRPGAASVAPPAAQAARTPALPRFGLAARGRRSRGRARSRLMFRPLPSVRLWARARVELRRRSACRAAPPSSRGASRNLAPSLSVEAGRYFSSRRLLLARDAGGVPEELAPLLRDVRYTYGAAHLGFELGSPRGLAFSLRVGLACFSLVARGTATSHAGRRRRHALRRVRRPARARRRCRR